MRWLAWGVACVVLVTVVAGGVVIANRDRPGRAVVSAAGDRSGTVDVTSTVTIPLPVQTSTPPSTVATTTTRPKAPVDVLNAIGSTTTTRRQATTTTTSPPAPTTTLPAPTTTTTVPAPFRATLVNEHPRAVVLIVNRGEPFSLAPGQTIADVELAFTGGDLVQVWLAEDNKCGVSDSGEIFKRGGRYRVSIVVGPTPCNGVAVPLLRMDPV
jgi:biotin carboxyl carrier protein